MAIILACRQRNTYADITLIIMNASHAFRSHLMQQFAAQARTQSRPPLALLGLLSDDDNITHSLPDAALDPWRADSSQRFRHLSSIETSSPSNSVNLRRRHTDSEVFQWSRSQRSLTPIIPPKQFSTKSANNNTGNSDSEGESCDGFDSSLLEGKFQLASSFQNLLKTRRTTSRFSALTASTPIYEERDYWNDALERAVLCGYQAPNHKRTEPFTFKRMIAPSERTERLAEIAFNVALRQIDSAEETLSADQISSRKDKAQRKRDKWSRIPAFLVATVQEEEGLFENDLETLNEYDQLPYIPPQTERALEDYASACAAVQNVLLSLHAESIATKWVTGPVIKTPAFRELIQAERDDRIVALIFVGQASGYVRKGPRRLRRPLKSGSANDVLVDLE